MAARNLGSLTIDLILRTVGLTQGADKAERELSRRTLAMQNTARKAGIAIGSALAAGAGLAAGALIASTKSAIDFADSIRDASIRVGASTETLSAYAYAAKQTGTDIDELSKGLLRLSRNATAALDPSSKQAGLFDALGVSKEALRDIELLVPQVANAFSQLEDGTTKAALAQELFGRSGASMIEFLNSGSAGLDEFARKAQELGIIIDQDTANAADEFNDTLANLRGAVQGLGVQIAGDLLPALTEAARGLINLVREGDLARNVVSVLDAALSAGVGAIEAYNTAVRVTSAAMSTFVEAGQGYSQAVRNIWAPFSDGTVKGGIAQMKQAFADFDKLAAKPANSPFANVISSASGPPRANDPGLNGRLNALLADRSPSKGGGGSKRSGKSDAERDAEQLERAYQSLNERLDEQKALFGETGEAARIRYEVESGALQALTQVQKDSVIAKAEQLDQMELEKELREAVDDAVLRETEAYEQQAEQVQDYIDDLKFETELLGMSNIEKERAIALRYANVDAMSEEGQKIIGLIDNYAKLAESAAFLEDTQSALSDSFADFITGAKSAKEAFGDFADDLFKRAAQFVADQAIKKLFDSFSGGGSASSGTGGFDWAELFGSFFGGGKASGGMGRPRTIYEVNERGFEMATVGGRDYMLTGSQPVQITPNNKLGGGLRQTNNIVIQGIATRQTIERTAQLTGRESQRAIARTGR